LGDKDEAVQHAKNRPHQTYVETDLGEELGEGVPIFRSSS